MLSRCHRSDQVQVRNTGHSLTVIIVTAAQVEAENKAGRELSGINQLALVENKELRREGRVEQLKGHFVSRNREKGCYQTGVNRGHVPNLDTRPPHLQIYW